MPVYKRKTTKSKRWYYKFEISGKIYKRTVPTARTKRQAEEAERNARQDVHEGKYSSNKPMLFTDFVREHYLPWAEKHHAENDVDKTMSDLLSEHFRSYTLAQISPMAIDGFKLKLAKSITQYGTVYKPNSVNLALGHLSGIMQMAVRYRLIAANPCRGIKRLPVPPKRPRYLLAHEEEVLLPACERIRFLGPLVQLAVWTGFRQNELLHLRRSSIDFARNVIFISNPKWKNDPRKTEGFPMSNQVKALVADLCESATDYLFMWKGKRVTKPVTDHFFRQTCRRVGISDLTFHSLRHTFGTRLGDRDVNQKKIARLMGHASTKHTEIYVHTTDAGLLEAVEIATKPASDRSNSVRMKAVSSL
jgi:integrase